MLDALYTHFSRYAAYYLWGMVAILLMARSYTLALNISNSLPGTIYLVEKNSRPQQGELAAFRYGGGGPYAKGVTFLKQVRGMPGAFVSMQEAGNGFTDFSLDGLHVGRAKPVSTTGMPLKPGPAGTIPPGHYYMYAPHPDSLDSRYSLVGWVRSDQIVGRAYLLF